MPTGPLHGRAENRIENGEIVQEIFQCRCMIGEDHIEGPTEVWDEQDEIVVYLTENLQTIEDDEFDRLFDQLDSRRQRIMERNIFDFANDAMGPNHSGFRDW